MRQSDQPIVAWRYWRIRTLGYPPEHDVTYERYLRSGVSDDVWYPMRRMEAVCRKSGPNPAERVTTPGQVCTHQTGSHHCGIHAWKDTSPILGADGRLLHTGQSPIESKMHAFPHVVIGRLSLWGRVVEHKDGWRAQYAYPLEFHIPPWATKRERAVLEPYGVPIVVREPQAAPDSTFTSSIRRMDVKVFTKLVGGPAHMQGISSDLRGRVSVPVEVLKEPFVYCSSDRAPEVVETERVWYDRVEGYLRGRPVVMWAHRHARLTDDEMADVVNAPTADWVLKP